MTLAEATDILKGWTTGTTTLGLEPGLRRRIKDALMVRELDRNEKLITAAQDRKAAERLSRKPPPPDKKNPRRGAEPRGDRK